MHNILDNQLRNFSAPLKVWPVQSAVATLGSEYRETRDATECTAIRIVATTRNFRPGPETLLAEMLGTQVADRATYALPTASLTNSLALFLTGFLLVLLNFCFSFRSFFFFSYPRCMRVATYSGIVAAHAETEKAEGARRSAIMRQRVLRVRSLFASSSHLARVRCCSINIYTREFSRGFECLWSYRSELFWRGVDDENKKKDPKSKKHKPARKALPLFVYPPPPPLLQGIRIYFVEFGRCE